MKKQTSIFYLSLLLLLALFTYSCDSTPTPKKKKKKSAFSKKATPKPFTFSTPYANDTILINDSFDLQLKFNDSTTVDSIHLFLNYKRINSFHSSEFKSLATSEKVGRNQLKAQVFFANGKQHSEYIDIYLSSDVVPEKLNYTILNKYSRPENHFTQGLVYHNGFIYEGTGNWGRSALYQSELKTGKPVRELKLPADVFGEGIAILNNKIVQVTYKKQEGYVYELETFKKIKTFKYPIYAEGWGLATDGTNLFMSTGTNKLYVLEDADFSIINELHVYDDHGPVNMLNELEYIDGFIYANIWLDNRIVKIDATSGKVIAELDMTSIIPTEYQNHQAKVLNGIAYNPENKHFYITGKDWKYLFEIQIN